MADQNHTLRRLSLGSPIAPAEGTHKSPKLKLMFELTASTRM